MRSHRKFTKAPRCSWRWSSWPSSRSSRCASPKGARPPSASTAIRLVATFALAAFGALTLPARLDAQSAPATPLPFVPLPIAPPAPTSPLGRGLAGAATAIDAARTSDPAAAQRGAAFYVRAQQQAAAGDVSGALASSSLARAAALSPPPGGGLAPAIPFSAAPAVGFPSVPLAAGGTVLPRELLTARDAIERAARTRHDSALDLAKSHYRRALDAYLSGDLARARRDARAAYALAAGTRTKGP